MSISMGIAVSTYLLLVFIFKMNEYIPLFFSNMLEGMENPLRSIIGIPMGVMLSFQRIFQTSEPVLGVFVISSLESNSRPKIAELVSLET